MTTTGPEPDDDRLLRRAVLELHSRLGMDVSYGGLVDPRSGHLTIRFLQGNHTDRLRGLRVPPGVGVGGQVLAHGRLVMADAPAGRERRSGRSDWAVADEGIRAVAAVPIRRAGVIWAVMYAATRSKEQIGSNVGGAFVEMARAFERFLSYHGGGFPGDAETVPDVRPPAPALKTLLRIEAELEGLTEQTGDDTAVRTRVESIRHLLHICYGYTGRVADHEPAFGLTPRELEVLRSIAEGHTNAETAEDLAVRPETVKSHLRNIMQKLGVHNRTAAVNVARRAGLVP